MTLKWWLLLPLKALLLIASMALIGGLLMSPLSFAAGVILFGAIATAGMGIMLPATAFMAWAWHLDKPSIILAAAITGALVAAMSLGTMPDSDAPAGAPLIFNGKGAMLGAFFGALFGAPIGQLWWTLIGPTPATKPLRAGWDLPT